MDTSANWALSRDISTGHGKSIWIYGADLLFQTENIYFFPTEFENKSPKPHDIYVMVVAK